LTTSGGPQLFADDLTLGFRLIEICSYSTKSWCFAKFAGIFAVNQQITPLFSYFQ